MPPMKSKKSGQLDLFPAFDFEDLQNGGLCWTELAYAEMLGYTNKRAFRGVIQRAMSLWAREGGDLSADFFMQPDGSFKLSRVACFFIATVADAKKSRVVQARMYFANLANSVFDGEHGERILTRGEYTERFNALSETARKAGVVNHALFHDAGYRGMYNMSRADLVLLKRVPQGEKLLDVMGPVELAANLLRLALTDHKIQTERVRGQGPAEAAAQHAGEAVRRAVMDSTGAAPEALPLAPPLRVVSKDLRDSSKVLPEVSKRPKYERLMGAIPVPEDEDEDASPPPPRYTPNPDEPEDEL